MVPGIIAIVGRPNVGKSALFNRIAGRRIAIVHDQPGVTRDRVTAEIEWNGLPLTLIDTGGLGLRRGEQAADVITRATVDQVDLAIEAAHAIIFVVNTQEGLVPLDQEVAARLRVAGKPVLLAANKSDNDRLAAVAIDFTSLGFERVYPVSATHGLGIDAVMEDAVRHLPSPEPVEPTGDDLTAQETGPQPLKLAVVGRPNVGKSSLVNLLTHSNRVVVTPIPGTTRDAVDVPLDIETEGRRERYVLVDTAGVRKRRRVDTSVEFFSVKRTEDAILRSDIVLFVLDALDGIREQDKKIGALITEAQRACIVIVNKWDLVADSVREAREEEINRRKVGSHRDARSDIPLTTLSEFGEWVQKKLFFLDYAPVVFASAKSGHNLERILSTVRYVAAQLRQRVPTGVLNRTLHDAIARRQPVSKRGEELRFYYATQIGQAPPRFLLFFNRKDLFTPVYHKYLTGTLRRAFGYEGCPIDLQPRARPKTIEPVRRSPNREHSPVPAPKRDRLEKRKPLTPRGRAKPEERRHRRPRAGSKKKR